MVFRKTKSHAPLEKNKVISSEKEGHQPAKKKKGAASKPRAVEKDEDPLTRDDEVELKEKKPANGVKVEETLSSQKQGLLQATMKGEGRGPSRAIVVGGHERTSICLHSPGQGCKVSAPKVEEGAIDISHKRKRGVGGGVGGVLVFGGSGAGGFRVGLGG